MCFDAVRTELYAKNDQKTDFWGLREDLKAKKSFFFNFQWESESDRRIDWVNHKKIF